MAVAGDEHLAAGDLARLDVVLREMLGDAFKALGRKTCLFGIGLHEDLAVGVWSDVTPLGGVRRTAR